MIKDGHEHGRQKWQCRVNERARQAQLYADQNWGAAKRKYERTRWPQSESRIIKMARYYERRDNGLCTRCGEPGLSEVLCWDCLNKAEERRVLRI